MHVATERLVFTDREEGWYRASDAPVPLCCGTGAFVLAEKRAENRSLAGRPEVIIRRVEPRDEAAIARLWRALSDYHVRLDRRLPVPTPGAAQQYAARLLEQRDDPLTRAFVAEVDGKVVGYLLGAVIDLQSDLFEYENTGFIADVYVDPEYRRQGIARRLVETISEWLAEEGVRHVEWQVATANADGIRFWEALGGRAITVRMRMGLDQA
jgi:ribosomal protein S18 acetylase RimI-like enzyme